MVMIMLMVRSTKNARFYQNIYNHILNTLIIIAMAIMFIIVMMVHKLKQLLASNYLNLAHSHDSYL